ncbi:cytochrome c oxidase assembly protein [Evansella halocellulosilytica]|uniref:cytochrome c oxidase assembly protein n=1 Tax=Evansella halocellulosilytica TaxID=2011013 RepID=UPI00211BA37E|nr:cytochrome c oxidase assembly protein [Evansella halocellulosilytica]
MNKHAHHLVEMFSIQGFIEVLHQVIFALPFVKALILYYVAVFLSNRRFRRWPYYRCIFWFFGVVSAAAAFLGPLAERAHVDFTVHMIVHLLLGMLSPLFIALSAPMTLIFRTLNVSAARRISMLIKSRFIRLFSDPVTASLLNIGGLWVLYTTNLYIMMHQHFVIHIFIHIHVFLAGYLFTIAMIYIDPSSHRTSFFYRSAIFVFALAGHGILAKYIYAYPPDGVSTVQAERGAIIMYYGGDIIDAIIIFIFCYQWYHSVRPRTSEAVYE